MRIDHQRLEHVARQLFSRAGSPPLEAGQIAEHLVDANLAGHDSHGVIRIPLYIDWLRGGQVRAGQNVEVLVDSLGLVVLDGCYGFGQSIGHQAIEIAIAKAQQQPVVVLALRNTGHLGRIGAWAEVLARAGLVSLHFVNSSGRGILVAPYGGLDRRLSANPLAVGVPVEGADPIILDISTCTIAEGKVRVALNQGVLVPEGCLLDAEGQPTRDPKVFYGDPPGAILPFGGHKGYGLSVIVEMLAGALSGSGCSDPANTERLVNGLLTIVLNPRLFPDHDRFTSEVRRFIDYLKSARVATPGGEILLPGEIEQRNRARRMREGIPIDEQTWSEIRATAGSLGINSTDLDEWAGL